MRKILFLLALSINCLRREASAGSDESSFLTYTGFENHFVIRCNSDDSRTLINASCFVTSVGILQSAISKRGQGVMLDAMKLATRVLSSPWYSIPTIFSGRPSLSSAMPKKVNHQKCLQRQRWS